jgi:hypothetical protein
VDIYVLGNGGHETKFHLAFTAARHGTPKGEAIAGKMSFSVFHIKIP